jgi:hypothetical protein
MSIQIATNNEIILDGRPTGYGVRQGERSTIVRGWNHTLLLPCARYSLTSDQFLKPGVGGVSRFEADFRAAIAV